MVDVLDREGLIEPEYPPDAIRARRPDARALEFPASRPVRLQNLARGPKALCSRSVIRASAATAIPPFAGEIRYGRLAVEFVPTSSACNDIGEIEVSECRW